MISTVLTVPSATQPAQACCAGCWGGKKPLDTPAAPLHSLETPDAFAVVNTATTNAATALLPSHSTGAACISEILFLVVQAQSVLTIHACKP